MLIEIMEDDPRESSGDRRVRQARSVVRSITASVGDLERAQRFWVDAVGLTPGDDVLHSREHETLWGLAGAERKSVVVWGERPRIRAGQYTNPLGKDWPAGYRISDQGIVNVAVGGPDREAWEHAVSRTRAAGYHHNLECAFRGVRVVYVDDDQGFSVELLYRSAENAALGGWEPSP